MRRAAALRVIGSAATALLAGCGASDCDIAVSPAVNVRPVSSRFGVQLYPSDDVQRAVSLIAACGGSLIRIGINGNYDFAGAVLAAAASRSMRVVLLTDFATQPVNIGAYASMHAGLQQRYAQYAPVWELWNEPNLEQYWGTPPDVEVYAALAIETAKALRAAGARDVWSGGTSGLDFNWVLGLKARGAFDVMNGCAVHSYEDPCDANAHYGLMLNLVPKNVFVHTTETCISGTEQADFLRDMWFIHRNYGLPTMIWCELRDGTAGAAGQFAFPYGLVDKNYAPKASYRTAEMLLRPRG